MDDEMKADSDDNTDDDSDDDTNDKIKQGIDTRIATMTAVLDVVIKGGDPGAAVKKAFESFGALAMTFGGPGGFAIGGILQFCGMIIGLSGSSGMDPELKSEFEELNKKLDTVIKLIEKLEKTCDVILADVKDIRYYQQDLEMVRSIHKTIFRLSRNSKDGVKDEVIRETRNYLNEHLPETDTYLDRVFDPEIIYQWLTGLLAIETLSEYSVALKLQEIISTHSKWVSLQILRSSLNKDEGIWKSTVKNTFVEHIKEYGELSKNLNIDKLVNEKSEQLKKAHESYRKLKDDEDHNGVPRYKNIKSIAKNLVILGQNCGRYEDRFRDYLMVLKNHPKMLPVGICLKTDHSDIFDANDKQGNFSEEFLGYFTDEQKKILGDIFKFIDHIMSGHDMYIKNRKSGKIIVHQLPPGRFLYADKLGTDHPYRRWCFEQYKESEWFHIRNKGTRVFVFNSYRMPNVSYYTEKDYALGDARWLWRLRFIGNGPYWAIESKNRNDFIDNWHGTDRITTGEGFSHPLHQWRIAR